MIPALTPTSDDTMDAAAASPQLTLAGQPAPGRSPASLGLIAVRYGVGGLMVLGGVIVLVVSPAGLGMDGFAMAVGGGLSVLLLNFLYRLGVSGDLERDREEAARVYFDEHGRWPDEEERPSGRTWVLAPGTVTLEQETAERNRRMAARDDSDAHHHGPAERLPVLAPDAGPVHATAR
jgi:hypothetical protein